MNHNFIAYVLETVVELWLKDVTHAQESKAQRRQSAATQGVL
jgi:hypothetical protein